MKLEDAIRQEGLHNEEDEEALDEYVHFAHMRFCRSDESGDFELSGHYFPNYQILYDKKTNIAKGIAFHQPRPTFPHMRDDSFTAKTETLQNQLTSAAGAVGLLYILQQSTVDGTISAWSASTFAVYEVRGKKIGITTLHTAKADKINPHTDRFFVDVTDTRWMDKTGIVSGDFANFTSDFVEVFIHKGSLAKRIEYLNSLNLATNNYKVNLDPEFGQCSEPVLDVMMFEVPAALQLWPHLTLAPNKPVKDDPAFLIAYHSTIGGRKNAKQEYLFTTRNPPLPREVVWIHCSLGVGKVVAVGEGLVTLINSTTHMSSGGPLLNEHLEVVAINLGGFYDDPGNPTKNPPPAVWTKISATDLFLADVKLPDTPASMRAKKNRNIGLSVFHSGFVSMLSVIAP